jgi:hypothetical protein
VKQFHVEAPTNVLKSINNLFSSLSLQIRSLETSGFQAKRPTAQTNPQRSEHFQRNQQREEREKKELKMNNVQRNFFKFLFILAVWSFLLIGLIKLNNDNLDLSSVSLATSQAYLKKIPLHRNLLQKEKWNQNFIDQTSTTSASERMMTFVDHEVLVDNRTGKKITYQT